ncbi:hypothetical protein BT96DRAFT_155703 [Gymnopus androsaceus JB14]|uniref:Uncharacterized protein n=1 Tax=Gymnopus androsaceus JB14 TaxID=1447944 RepID=A0A6A4HDG2_9AGAR|nr:hypothetical protein BT96DRAFT_155703 [Gymnopus androsaceus JB14]
MLWGTPYPPPVILFYIPGYSPLSQAFAFSCALLSLCLCLNYIGNPPNRVPRLMKVVD